MSVTKPFRRHCRPFKNGQYFDAQNWHYILHPKYALNALRYYQAFLLILKDAREIFEYVEPADLNENCYSYRIHELLMRTCIEVEANCKAIMLENNYVPPDKWSMSDYRKIDGPYRLSSYQVRAPQWTGSIAVQRPFAAWNSSCPSLPWYKAYNQSKHDRHANFAQASLGNLLSSVCGLAVLMSAQFWMIDFSPTGSYEVYFDLQDGYDHTIGRYFRVKFLADWAPQDRYEFDWTALNQGSLDPFQNVSF